MDAFLPERASSDSSHPVADADADLHDLQHMALPRSGLRRYGRVLLIRLEEIGRRRRDWALSLTCLQIHSLMLSSDDS